MNDEYINLGRLLLTVLLPILPVFPSNSQHYHLPGEHLDQLVPGSSDCLPNSGARFPLLPCPHQNTWSEQGLWYFQVQELSREVQFGCGNIGIWLGRQEVYYEQQVGIFVHGGGTLLVHLPRLSSHLF